MESPEPVLETSIFASGWRPFIGWICAAGFALQLIVGPIVNWLVVVLGGHIQLPSLDTSTLMALLFAMLGLGGLRTVEKVKGVQ